MKNFKSVIFSACFLIVFVAVGIALAVDYFGPEAVERTFWILFSLAMLFVGMHISKSSMYSGAKIALAAQESDDRRERASMNTMGKFLNTIRSGGGQQPALPMAAEAPVNSTEQLIFEDADFELTVEEPIDA